jgi:hypothetical protein
MPIDYRRERTVNSIGDNVLLTFGAGNDAAMLLRSTALAADAELTGVIVGTSDHPGVAANSLMIANKTDDGDIMLAVTDGSSNTNMSMLLDASAGALALQGLDLHFDSAGVINFNSGDVTLTHGANLLTMAGGDFVTSGDISLGGDLIFTAVSDIDLVNDNKFALQINDDAGNTYYTINTLGVKDSFANRFDTENLTLPSATDGIYGLAAFNSYNLNYTGTTSPTELLTSNTLFERTNILGSASLTIPDAATVTIQSPQLGANTTFTMASALRIQDGVDGGTAWTSNAGIYIEAMAAGDTNNYAIYTNAGDVRFGDAVTLATNGIKFLGSLDSAAVADQVAIGGYEIGAGNRVLAISSETAVTGEADETKFNNKLQVRINGTTYYIMLTTT